MTHGFALNFGVKHVMAEMPITPKGYCDGLVLGEAKDFGHEAEMPITPKGYCDCWPTFLSPPGGRGAEMPLTPKGYCD